MILKQCCIRTDFFVRQVFYISIHRITERPRWYSARDKELLAAKAQLEHAPPGRNVQELHAPTFQNISKSIRCVLSKC